MNRRTLLLGASAVGLVAFAGGAYLFSQRRAAEAAATAATTPVADDALLVRAYSPRFGPDDAPVTLVEFFDPSCEACRAFHPVLQEIRRQFPTEVRIVMRYTAFHEGSDEAVRILETARMQDKFEPVLDALLEQQPNWALHDGPQMIVAWQIAATAGLDMEKAEGDRLFPGITGVLNQDRADVESLEIMQTPTFFLNGRRLEDVSFDSLLADVAAAVAAQP